MPDLTGPVIYYGVQLLAIRHPEKLWAEKLFVMRSACVPVDEWTEAMWGESARIVGRFARELTPDLGLDPTTIAVVAAAVRRDPDYQAHDDVKSLSPRPTDEQLAEVKALAELYKTERTTTRRHYDLELTPDLGFAVVYGKCYTYLESLRQLPGYCEVDGHPQVWLSSELLSFIEESRIECAPNVLAAISDEIERLNEFVPWGEALEKASSCCDPDIYPAKLIPLLKEMEPKGISWS